MESNETKEIVLSSGKKADEVTITDLMRELSEIEPTSWTEETVGYEVRK